MISINTRIEIEKNDIVYVYFSFNSFSKWEQTITMVLKQGFKTTGFKPNITSKALLMANQLK